MAKIFTLKPSLLDPKPSKKKSDRHVFKDDISGRIALHACRKRQKLQFFRILQLPKQDVYTYYYFFILFFHVLLNMSSIRNHYHRVMLSPKLFLPLISLIR